MSLIRSILLIVSVVFSGSMYSQATSTVTLTLPIVTLMDIEPAGNITLSFTAPTEAGNALANPTANTTKWINYSSAIASGGLTRRITAAVNQVIQGVNITLIAAAASGAGGGTLGTSSGQVTLTTTPVTIISGIGGAFTGNGTNNGHGLTISIVPSTYALLQAQSNTAVTVVYTITE